jgi:predicted DNA-binding transcriptional regulator AlpA
MPNNSNHECSVETFAREGPAIGLQIEPKTLTEKSAAIYIGMSVSWLRQSRNMENPDAPPHLKIGKSVRYLRADLDAWLLDKRRH